MSRSGAVTREWIDMMMNERMKEKAISPFHSPPLHPDLISTPYVNATSNKGSPLPCYILALVSSLPLHLCAHQLFVLSINSSWGSIFILPWGKSIEIDIRHPFLVILFIQVHTWHIFCDNGIIRAWYRDGKRGKEGEGLKIRYVHPWINTSTPT